MSESWYLMNSPNDRISGFELDDFNLHSLSGFNELLEFSPESYSVLVNGVEKQVIIQQTSKDDILKILSNLNDFKTGDIVDHEQTVYLITTKPLFNKMYQVAELSECLSSLKWMDEFGEIYETPFALNSDTLSNFGIEEGRVIALSKERRNISIQQNIHTRKFKKEKRFIFDDKAWEVTGDSKLKSGLINMVLEEGQFDTSKDNIPFRIANYIAPHYEIIVDKTSLSLQVGESKTLDITVKNNNVTIPSPTLSYFSSDESICVVDETGLIESVAEGNAVVTVTFKDVNLDVVVDVASIASHNYTVEIIDNAATKKFEITRNRTKTFTCQFRDNGVDIIETGTFIATPITVSSNSIATITSQGNNSCVIKGDNVGTVMLTVRNSDGTIVGSQVITIKTAI